MFSLNLDNLLSFINKGKEARAYAEGNAQVARAQADALKYQADREAEVNAERNKTLMTIGALSIGAIVIITIIRTIF